MDRRMMRQETRKNIQGSLYILQKEKKRDYFTENFECLLQIWKFKKIIILLKNSSANCKYDNNGTFSYIGLLRVNILCVQETK